MLVAAAAATTRRVRLGTMVTANTYRHPGVLAKMAATVDHLSGGRLEFGIGAGWSAPEHQMLGIDFPGAGERVRRLDEACSVVELLWTRSRVDFDGRHYRLQGAIAEPKPVQRPHPPIWIGANGPKRGLPTAAKWADVWHTFAPPEHYAVMSKRVDQLAEAAGRDPAAIRRAGSLSISEPWDEVRRNTDAMRAVGVSYLVCSWPGEGEARVGEFAEHVMSEFTE